MANAKHFIANEQEHYRTTSSSNVDDRTIHELYALPFLYSVRAGVGSFMCSYNLVNNTYACENDRTLNQILKKEFGYKGFVMSDWSATMSGAKSINAGLDMTMPGDITMGSRDSYFGANLTKALQNGEVSASRLDDMAVRILAPWYLLNQDKDFPATNLNSFNQAASKQVVVSADHYKIIRAVGAASNVLLKNTHKVLPLSKKTKTHKSTNFALIGSDAGPSPKGPNPCNDRGCVDGGTLAQGWGSGTTNFPYLITPLDAIQARATQRGQSVGVSLDDYDYKKAVEVAAAAEVALVFGNSNSGEGYITVDGNEGDRNNMSLWHNGDDLIKAVAAVNTRTVVVIHSVGPVLMPWIDHPNISAVIMAGLPGQESGNGLADVLFGDVNPSGRLIYTLAKKESDYGTEIVYQSNAKYPPVDYNEGLFIDYRHFDAKNIEPMFPFGHGLSYTRFAYSGVSVMKNKGRFSANNTNVSMVDVSFKIQNTGKKNGHEVPQLYIGFPASTGEPPKQLKGFDRVFINAGATAEVKLRLTPLDLAVWNVVQQKWENVAGVYKVYVGTSSRDIRLNSEFTLGK